LAASGGCFFVDSYTIMAKESIWKNFLPRKQEFILLKFDSFSFDIRPFSVRRSLFFFSFIIRRWTLDVRRSSFYCLPSEGNFVLA